MKATFHDRDYCVVPKQQWSQHPWLSALKHGTDIDSTSASFYTRDDAPAPLAALDQILLQIRHELLPDWEDLGRSDGAFYPGWNDAEGCIGWLDHYWFAPPVPYGEMEFRALIPAAWDCATIPPQSDVPTIPYFSAWRMRTWTCLRCHWSGTNEGALVFRVPCGREVSVACPHCGTGLADISPPTSQEIEAAASEGDPEALAMKNPRQTRQGKYVTGHEEVVRFADGHRFFGVPPEWLLPRLRLDRHRGSFDLSDGLYVEINDERFENLESAELMGAGPNDGLLLDIDNGGGSSIRFEVVGGWLADSIAEVRHHARWIGFDRDLSELARELIADRLPDCLVGEVGIHVNSPYLSAGDPEDVRMVLTAAHDSIMVALNGQSLRDSP